MIESEAIGYALTLLKPPPQADAVVSLFRPPFDPETIPAAERVRSSTNGPDVSIMPAVLIPQAVAMPGDGKCGQR